MANGRSNCKYLAVYICVTNKQDPHASDVCGSENFVKKF